MYDKMFLKILLPYPPSVNTYWGFHGSRRFLTPKATAFKKEVADAFVACKQQGFGDARLFVTLRLNPPDKRQRDIDNVVKSTLDALVQAGVFNDDSQVDGLLVLRQEIVKGGRCSIEIRTGV